MYRISAWILYQSMRAIGTELSYRPASLRSLAGQYTTPSIFSFVATMDCSKIAAQEEGEKKEDQIF
jgi:hypothetical protein